MEFEVIPHGDTCNVVRLKGRMDATGVERIETRFTAAVVASSRDAVIDLSQVEFLASMGIRLFIGTARAMASKGRKAALYGAPYTVKLVLDAVALHEMIPVVADQQQALSAISA